MNIQISRHFTRSLLNQLEATLHYKLSPIELKVFNESDKHSRGPETHYRILVVTDKFNDVSMI